ncbi:hypothetical protein Clacol_008048 [Clathrus columnatus]|uniref:Golgi apparatus membrane protein TVP23 n=1 Tax=Clathrus columnatus TaxID=1419009 RepID=A0AAV5AMZ0_9AGAM|nr:hypothetical protein Clacol_008048 [Clathrus columnatus]
MSVNASLLHTIEPDEVDEPVPSGRINGPTNSSRREPVVLTPTNHTAGANSVLNSNATPNELESGLTGILKQSSHPLGFFVISICYGAVSDIIVDIALFFLYFFRVSAITTYILCGFFTDNYVLSTVIVVVLLAMDFWNCRNVAGRTLVGLRYWNQVDEDGESYWVFESRDDVLGRSVFFSSVMDPSTPSLHIKIQFLPIVILALVFNYSNAIGFTDRDAKAKWTNSVASGLFNFGGIGGQLLGGMVKNSVGRVFG